jgi:hypothetical protein
MHVIKFAIDLRQVGGFPPVSSPNKTDRHDITEILLKVALNTINHPTYNRKIIHDQFIEKNQDLFKFKGYYVCRSFKLTIVWNHNDKEYSRNNSWKP